MSWLCSRRVTCNEFRSRRRLVEAILAVENQNRLHLGQRVVQTRARLGQGEQDVGEFGRPVVGDHVVRGDPVVAPAR